MIAEAAHGLPIWAAPGATHDGHDWAGRTVSSAEVVLAIEKAESSKVAFEARGFDVVGKLELSNREFKSPLRFIDCRLADGVDIRLTSLKSLSFESCVVGSDASPSALEGEFVQVATDFDLSSSTFGAPIDLSRSKITGSLVLSDSRLAQSVALDLPSWSLVMNAATLGGDLKLDGVKSRGGLALASSKIGGQLDLRGAVIEAGVAIGDGNLTDHSHGTAVWAQRCSIGESILAGGESANARLTGYVDLKWTKIGGQVTFRNSQLDRLPNAPASNRFGQMGRTCLDLFGATIGEVLDLRGILTTEPATEIDLRRATTSRLRLDCGEWGNFRYGVVGLTFRTTDETGKPMRDWLQRSESGPTPEGFLLLAQVAASRGETSHALKAKIRASSAAANKLEQALLGWIRYGYRPYLVAVPLLLLGLATFLQVKHASEGSGIAPITVDSTVIDAQQCDDQKTRCLNEVTFALDAVLPVDLKQVSSWRANTDQETGRYLNALLIVDELASWLFAGVLVAAVAGLLKRT